MKRVGNVYDRICCINNLEVSESKARKGKKNQYGVKFFDKNRDINILILNETLLSCEFKTSEYTHFTVLEPKERIISRLPYFPDRIVHHAILNVLEQIFVSYFTADTYACIKGRGIHKMATNIKNALKDEKSTKYCLKFDITKFYPNVNHAILKRLLRRKFKDARLLNMLDEIIDSSEGIPLGNYLSQYFGNFYLTEFDRWLKEKNKVKHLFRYCDDVIILAETKEELHNLFVEINKYLWDHLRLTINKSHQVFPVDKRGIDIIGYVFHRKYILLRKKIKKRFARIMSKNPNTKSIASYYGWAIHANTKHLLNKLFNEKILGNSRNVIPNAIKYRINRGKDKNGTYIKQGNSNMRMHSKRLNKKGRNKVFTPAN